MKHYYIVTHEWCVVHTSWFDPTKYMVVDGVFNMIDTNADGEKVTLQRLPAFERLEDVNHYLVKNGKETVNYVLLCD